MGERKEERNKGKENRKDREKEKQSHRKRQKKKNAEALHSIIQSTAIVKSKFFGYIFVRSIIGYLCTEDIHVHTWL